MCRSSPGGPRHRSVAKLVPVLCLGDGRRPENRDDWRLGVRASLLLFLVGACPQRGIGIIVIDLWLGSGTVGIILVPFVLLYLIAVGIVWLTHLSPARAFFASCIGIAGPFFASVAVLFGLFSAFLANDVQHRNAELRAAVFREGDGIRTIMRLAEAFGEVGRPLTTAAVGYTQSVLTKELQAMRERSDAPEDLGPLRSLTFAVLAPELITAVPTAAHQAMLDGLVEVRQARLERLTLTASGI